MPIDTRLTYDDYCLLPDDGKRYEIVDGELFVTPSPTILHRIVVSQLLSELLTVAKKHGLGRVLAAPVDVVFSEFDVVEPDIVYILKQRASVMTEKTSKVRPIWPSKFYRNRPRKETARPS